MAKVRKTISVAQVVKKANTALASTYFTDEQKSGICSLLEGILMDSNAYKGYNTNERYQDAVANGTEHSRTYYLPAELHAYYKKAGAA